MKADEPLIPKKGQTELFRLLVESVRDYAIFLLDPDGVISSWNVGAQRIKGYAPSEIIGKHFSIFYPPRDVQHGKPDYALRIAADEGRWHEEGWRVRKDGSRFWASVTITALFDDQGDLVGFAKVTRDLTERKREEEERAQLLELEHAARLQAESAVERLHIIQTVTEAALSHLDLDSLLVTLLDRIAETLSVDTVAVLLLDESENVLVARAAKGVEEEVEQGVRIPVGKGFAGRIAAQREAVALDDVDHADVMNPILRQKGIKSLLGVPLMVEGRVLGVLHVGSLHRRHFTTQEIQLLQIVGDRAALAIDHARLFEAVRTARHEAAVAEAAVKARDEFLAIAAHELKTPLTTLRLAGQTLIRRMGASDAADKTALQPMLLVVDRQVDRLATLVTHLLETVRLQSGTMELDRDATDMVELVRSVVDQLQMQTGRHQIVMSAPEKLPAYVDALRFDQVVVNLLDNAVKYSPDGGQIDVHLEQSPAGAVWLSIRDRGMGIPLEHRSHLFERFYQAHRQDHRSGMGLGLYITQQIVERHGGTIRAEFPPDGGTRFIVELPAASAESRSEVVA